MTITVKEISSYENYGRCVSISNSEVELLVTIDIGPRIIKYGFIGGTNVMFNDLDRKTCNSGKQYDDFYYEGAKWMLYGGHRLWVAPEASPNTYYPDHNPVLYFTKANGAVFSQSPQKENELKIELEIEMNCDGSVQVMHRVYNLSEEPKKLAPWALTVLDKGGLEIIPQNPEKEGMLPNRRIIAWPYTDLTDQRIYFGTDYITVKQDDSFEGALKLGLDARQGVSLYVNKDTVFIKNFTHDEESEYPDMGVSFETYVAGFLEMETLGAYKTLSTGAHVSHTEIWRLAKTDSRPDARNEKEIDAFVKRYI